ncbi:hypothetical protein AB0B63_06785 [Micromonospora sp. NPDC049081]|uniref:hypothetical protein n=1 Tax=Micromonospora sp. NPDC049081 TaxID=3155150 RepID=UPI0033FE7D05
MTRRYWSPLGARTNCAVPAAGNLIAHEHAVWRVTAVNDLPLSDADRDVWLDAGMPDLATWHGRPQRLDVQWIGGARPQWATLDGPVQEAHLNLPAATYRPHDWHIYPSDRWPMCSCCGEPMPCRAELQDREVAASLTKVEEFVSRRPGTCWGCGEPINRRQKSVHYPGGNLDMPGGHDVHFHTRESCRSLAKKYELRWIAEDPRRERILTYPKCGGILIVHADGSSECQSGRDPLGTEAVGEPECRGHLTHDHGAYAACYVGDEWFEHPSRMPGCPRGCSRDGHPGTRTSRRPERRRQSSGAELPL